MEENNMAYCREELELLSTRRLDELLQKEVKKDQPDGDTVRLILKILKERDSKHPAELTPEAEQAWARYKADTKKSAPSATPKFNWLLKVASVVVIIGVMVVAVPQTVQAENLFDRIARWTDDFFQLLTVDDPGNSEEYVFRTDNPGLQQIYDAVVELGVTEPVVPMWMPGDYELSSIEIIDQSDNTHLVANLSYGGKPAIFQLSIYSQNISSSYYKDDTSMETCEINGISYNIMQNKSEKVVVWTVDNIECFIGLDCQENELYQILESIHAMEDR